MVRIEAPLLRARAQLRVAQVGEVRVVQLQVAAACAVQRVDLVAIAAREIVEELVHVRIRVDVDRFSPAAEVDHRRRRNRDLRRLRGHRLQELEIRLLNVDDVAQLAGDREARRREIDHPVAAVEFRLDAAADRHAFELFQEVDVKEGAAELAVGHALQPGVLLLPDDVADVRVFDPPQLVLRDGAGLLPAARLDERRRPQEAADVVCAEGWIVS